MAHAHDHPHDNSYYFDQLFMIGVSGAIGTVTVLMWWSGKMNLILAEKFHLSVLAGGVVLLAMVLIRAVALWFEVDEATAPAEGGCCDHDHSHDHHHDHDHAHEGCCTAEHHDHDHAHDHGIQPAPSASVTTLPLAPAPVHSHAHGHGHGHSHGGGADHGHDHGGAPWRYVVLVFPVLLYLLDLPNDTFRGLPGTALEDRAAFDPLKAVKETGVDFTLGFTQLEEAAKNPDARDRLEGKTVRLTGRFFSSDEKLFTLVRYKITCCAADARPINVATLVDPNSKATLDYARLNGKWTQIIGRVQFMYRPDTNEYRTAVVVYPTDKQPLTDLIKEMPPDPNPYVS
jgi:hypothetical protein